MYIIIDFIYSTSCVLTFFYYFYYNKNSKKNLKILISFTYLFAIALILILYNVQSIDYTFVKIKIIILIIAATCLAASFEYLCKNDVLVFSILFIISVQANSYLVLSNDLFLSYLLIELQSLCFYILAAWNINSNYSLEAGLKYYINGAFISSFFVFGISLIYGAIGTTKFWNISLYNEIFQLSNFSNWMLQLGVFFVLAGILFKLSIVPFHVWVSDVYEGSILPVTFFFSIVPKIGIFIFFLKIMWMFNFYYLEIIAIISIIYGSLVSLYQVKIKRLLAYGTISHMGYIFLAASTFTIEGWTAGLAYMFIYIIVLINIFSILLAIQQENSFVNITDFTKLLKSNKILALILAFSFLSLAGMPPFMGFFAKFYVFYSLSLKANFLGLTIIIFFSVLSCAYYLRLIRFLFFIKQEKSYLNFKITKQIVVLIICFTFLLNLFFFVFQAPFLIFLKNLILEILIWKN